MPCIGKKKNVPAILISSVNLIQIADGAQHHHAFNPAPVNGIRYFNSLRVLALRNQSLDLVRTYFVFIFIQSAHLIISLFYLFSVP